MKTIEALKERGRVDGGDIMHVVGAEMNLRMMAHANAVVHSISCEACAALSSALSAWFEAHSPEAQEALGHE